MSSPIVGALKQRQQHSGLSTDDVVDAVAAGTMGWWGGALTGAAAAGISGIMLALSANDAAIAEDELRRKREASHELDLTMKKISLALEGWENKKTKLVSLQFGGFLTRADPFTGRTLGDYQCRLSPTR